MIALDTDHLTIYAFPDSQGYHSLSTRIRNSPEEFGTTIVCVEEQMRGWLAPIKRKPDPSDQVPVYFRLARWQSRIGSQDLKIAAIALTCDALLLSANLRDFRRISGLRVENWLES